MSRVLWWFLAVRHALGGPGSGRGPRGACDRLAAPTCVVLWPIRLGPAAKLPAPKVQGPDPPLRRSACSRPSPSGTDRVEVTCVAPHGSLVAWLTTRTPGTTA